MTKEALDIREANGDATKVVTFAEQKKQGRNLRLAHFVLSPHQFRFSDRQPGPPRQADNVQDQRHRAVAHDRRTRLRSRGRFKERSATASC